MLEIIIDYYKKRNVNLPKKEAELISKQLTVRSLKKKEFFHKTGELNSSIGFISKGCVRVYIKDKKELEYNRHFVFENSCIGELHQILNKNPTTTSIQALENTELYEVSGKAYRLILNECPVFAMASLKSHLNDYASILEKEEIKKTLTIEEKYADLMENHSEMIERVPLYHIASYLGIKPESLSRVKKKFKVNSIQEALES